MPTVAISQSAPQGLSRAPNTNSDNSTRVRQAIPATSGGTVYYLNRSSGPNVVGGAGPINVPSTALMSIGVPEIVPVVSIATPRTEPTAFAVQYLAQLLASSRNDHLPEWNLVQYNGDSLQGHEWFGEFKSAIDSALLM